MYTAGELAKKLGVSARTVRFYDEKGILRPVGYSEAPSEDGVDPKRPDIANPHG